MLRIMIRPPFNLFCINSRTYSKKISMKGGKGVAAVVKKKELDVETDTNILVNYCCVNYKIDEEPIKLKPDNEYPDWLWKLPIEAIVPSISEGDKNTYSYWRRVRAYNRKKKNRLASIEGWAKKDHNDSISHVARFYGDWYFEMKKWEEEKKCKMMSSDQPFIEAEVKHITA